MASLSLFSLFCMFSFLLGMAHAQLSSDYYSSSCPSALSTIQTAVNNAVADESRMGASLLRLHFHDCFGCDASILLDDTANFTGEKTAGPNNNSVRGYDVIDTIKSQMESLCPGVVSCADIVAVAARDSVVALGGPTWTVQLGRRDSTTASFSTANSDLPAPTSDLDALISLFSNKGFTTQEMVVLSGTHTIGKAQCSKFRDRIYNETNIDATFATSKQAICPNQDKLQGNKRINLNVFKVVLQLISGSSLSQSDLRYISCLWHLYFAHQLKGSSQIKFLFEFLKHQIQTFLRTLTKPIKSVLPGPTLNLSQLVSAFSNKGFTTKETVVLSGVSFPLSNGPSMCISPISLTVDTILLFFRTKGITVIRIESGGDDNLSPLDKTTTVFYYAYFRDLKEKKGLLHSDQQLYNDGSTDSIVESYSINSATFFRDVTNAMVLDGKS
ncbi:unnamed protein product, partial [Vitis vinifera]